MSITFFLRKKITKESKLKTALKNIYGINNYQSLKICKYFGINNNLVLKKLKKLTFNKIKKYIHINLKIDKQLKKIVKNNIDNLLKKKTRRGLRYAKGLPIHGQRTKTNAKTSKKKITI